MSAGIDEGIDDIIFKPYIFMCSVGGIVVLLAVLLLLCSVLF